MRKWMHTLVCVTLAATGGIGCTAAGNPNIEPRADAALRRMSDTLAKAQAFTLHSTATVDETLESGQVAQFQRNSTIVISRPDRMCADVHRGPESYKLWFQGSELTILDTRRDIYATVKTPSPIGEMLDFMAEKHGVVVPLADLLYPNPYEVLTERVKTGTYVDQAEVDGRVCDHLLFTQDKLSWQVWIDAGSVPVPRKFTITYKDDPDEPQYEAVLDEWKLASPADLAKLAPQLPKSARRVEVAEIVDPEEGD